MEVFELFPNKILIDSCTKDELEEFRKEIDLVYPDILPFVEKDMFGDNISGTFKNPRCLVTRFGLNKIKGFVDNYIREYTKLYFSLEPESQNIKLIESWLNFGKKHAFQNYHVHANNLITAVLYLDAPPGSGDIVFVPSSLAEYNLKGEYAFTPKTGNIFVFHGAFPHSVRYNKTDMTRITLALNYKTNANL